MKELTKLFEPIKIGNMDLKNRLVMAPLATGTVGLDGRSTDRIKDFLAARARGGVGLIILQNSTILYESRALGRFWVHDDECIPWLRELAHVVKQNGAKVAIELGHHGALQAVNRLALGLENLDDVPVLAPSPIPVAGTDVIPKEMDERDIHRLVDGWAEAARRVKEAGFDAVEVYGGSGYLISQFRSPLYNRRRDYYGKSSENRARFACEVLKGVRKKVGPDFPIIFRISGSDYSEGGATIEDSVRQASLFVESGADALEVAGGSIESRDWVFPSYLLPPIPNLPSAEAIKKVIGIPVIVCGKIGDPFVANQIIQEGKVDLVSLGRTLFADPEWPKKVKEGRFDEICYCIYCNNCTKYIGRGDNPLMEGCLCTVNPSLLREREFQIKPTEMPKKVMVIGGGLGGMEAARTLAERGHQVSLYEKNGELGGQWNIATQFEAKRGFASFTRYLINGLQKAGVEVIFNKEITLEFVEEVKPDVIVVATGAVPKIPNIRGVNGKNVVKAIDVVWGKARPGDRVVVVGGDWMGLETANLLAKGKKMVIIVEALNQLGKNTEIHIYKHLLQSLIAHRVQFLTGSPVFEIREKGVYVLHQNQPLFLNADTVVLATGVRPNNKLVNELIRGFPHVYPIGDCVEPRNALEAVREGAEIGCKI